MSQVLGHVDATNRAEHVRKTPRVAVLNSAVKSDMSEGERPKGRGKTFSRGVRDAPTAASGFPPMGLQTALPPAFDPTCWAYQTGKFRTGGRDVWEGSWSEHSALEEIPLRPWESRKSASKALEARCRPRSS